jgi:hypothetical protein
LFLEDVVVKFGVVFIDIKLNHIDLIHYIDKNLVNLLMDSINDWRKHIVALPFNPNVACYKFWWCVNKNDNRRPLVVVAEWFCWIFKYVRHAMQTFMAKECLHCVLENLYILEIFPHYLVTTCFHSYINKLEFPRGTLSVKFGIYVHHMTTFNEGIRSLSNLFFITLLLCYFLIYTY